MKRQLASVMTFAVLAGVISAAGPDATFLNKIPASANAIMYMDVNAAYTSPLGRKEEWAKRYAQTQHASLNSIPPTVERVMVAVQYDLGRMAPLWRIGVMKTDWLISLSDIAKKAGSTMEDIAGKSAVYLQRGAYIAPFGDKELVTYYPGNRQAFARWVDGYTEGGYPGPAPYLKNAVTQTGNATMVMAVDMKYAMDEASIRPFMNKLPSLKGRDHEAALATEVIASMKGFTLAVMITDRIQAKLRIDFGRTIKGKEGYLPTVVDDLMSQGGVVIDDFREWTPSFDATSMTLEGRLSASNLHRVLSLFEIPGDVGYRQIGDKSDAPNELANQAIASRRYYNALSALLTELKNVKMLDDKPVDDRYKRYAYWYQSYAQKIGQLDSRNVDPELAAFGGQLSYELGAITSSLRGVPTTVNALDQTIYYQRGWGWWGGGGTNAGSVLGKEGKAMTDDIKLREQVWANIDNGMAQLKTKLSDKYKMPF